MEQSSDAISIGGYSLTRQQVARRLKIGPQQVYIIAKKDPSFPRPVRIGQRDRWSPEDIDAWERARLGIVREENKRRLDSLAMPAVTGKKRAR